MPDSPFKNTISDRIEAEARRKRRDFITSIADFALILMIMALLIYEGIEKAEPVQGCLL